ncbi:MAG: GlcG/HbpS family heme-binding protein [Lachnospiraceae bacterium]
MDERIIRQVVESVTEQMGRTRTYEDVTLEMAELLIRAVEQEAARMGVNVVIAVTNRGANPVAVHCMDDSFIASYDIALSKAYTCAAVKMSTLTLKSMSQPGGGLYGIQNTNQGKIVIFGGGIPIFHNRVCIGGLGVSGGSEEQDTALAEYGEKLIKEGVLWQSTK